MMYERPASGLLVPLPGRNQLLNAFLLLCCCTFVVYQLQEAALTAESARSTAPAPAPVVSYEDELDSAATSINVSNSSSKIWVTMGLCWSANTGYHDKGGFPYRSAAPLAARLWMRFTTAKVVLQVRRKKAAFIIS